jgi:hypothetical protein
MICRGLKIIATKSHLPVLIHCFHGKDRTGAARGEGSRPLPLSLALAQQHARVWVGRVQGSWLR